jgi:hypothetical protein
MVANTGKNSIEIHGMSIHLLGIIRMEPEGVEKLGVEGLMSGVQGMGMQAGKQKILRKEDGTRSRGKSQKPQVRNRHPGHPAGPLKSHDTFVERVRRWV